jgi:hypothetical protein
MWRYQSVLRINASSGGSIDCENENNDITEEKQVIAQFDSQVLYERRPSLRLCAASWRSTKAGEASPTRPRLRLVTVYSQNAAATACEKTAAALASLAPRGRVYL